MKKLTCIEPNCRKKAERLSNYCKNHKPVLGGSEGFELMEILKEPLKWLAYGFMIWFPAGFLIGKHFS